MRPTDEFFHKLSEPNKSCNLALRHIIMTFSENIEEAWKYKLPFFMYQGKPLCYLWMDKNTKHPYIGFVKGKYLNHPDLIQGNRKKMKILPINPKKNIPKKLIQELIRESIRLY